LLQKAGIPEIQGYGTFPVSGHFLRTDNPKIVAQHQAKVYSQAQVGAPPMSVPHLDTRVVDGKTSLLFGPFAGLNPKFLKYGSILDLPLSLRPKNLIPYLSVALKNFGLVTYLVKEVTKSRKKKIAGLQEFVPNAKPEDWTLYEAGQRAQVIKPVKGGGVLQFGTEVISSKDGTISGLLGASPGASVSVSVMLDVMNKMYPETAEAWMKGLAKVIPALGKSLNADPKLAKKSLADTAKALKLKA
jgi:malate dehydrogenase (quinone)